MGLCGRSRVRGGMWRPMGELAALCWYHGEVDAGCKGVLPFPGTGASTPATAIRGRVRAIGGRAGRTVALGRGGKAGREWEFGVGVRVGGGVQVKVPSVVLGC